MLLKIAVLLSVFAGSMGAFATSQELSRTENDTIEIFLKNLPNLTIKNAGGTEQAEFPAIKMFSQSLAASSGKISANCTFRARTLIEDCSIVVQEGGSEGMGGVARIYSFSLVRGNFRSKSIEVVGAL